MGQLRIGLPVQRRHLLLGVRFSITQFVRERISIASACLRLLLGCSGILVAGPIYAGEENHVQILLSPTEALNEIFAEVASVDTVSARLTTDEMRQLRRELGRFSGHDSLLVLIPRGEQGDTLGYAVIDEEIGKYRPITFMVGTDPDLKIRGVEILVYRESRGGEVRRQRFLRQYRDKTTESAIRLNRDILNVAGATLSVRALNHGIKRVLQSLAIVTERNQSESHHEVHP